MLSQNISDTSIQGGWARRKNDIFAMVICSSSPRFLFDINMFTTTYSAQAGISPQYDNAIYEEPYTEREVDVVFWCIIVMLELSL